MYLENQQAHVPENYADGPQLLRPRPVLLTPLLPTNRLPTVQYPFDGSASPPKIQSIPAPTNQTVRFAKYHPDAYTCQCSIE